MKMAGISSNTGLIAARIHPINKHVKYRKVELSGTSKPAPFILRPFAGLFNPFPYGCSVLCNHPADIEAKEFVKRAKESWATEGKAILLPAELDMIRATLLAGGIASDDIGSTDPATLTTVPEELFRKYTETDSRPLTPTPTLASGPVTDVLKGQQDATCYPRERTTLILDLRTSSQEQANETLSWHSVTLEPPPSPVRRHSEFSKLPPLHHHSNQLSTFHEISDEKIWSKDKNEKSESIVELPIKRRGRRLKKRKCRRGSTYGQPTEVRDPMEPLETQVSQVGVISRINSTQVLAGNVDQVKNSSEEQITPSLEPIVVTSFISSDILRHLTRELDRDKVEQEFSLKKRMALEEALRVKGEANTRSFRISSVQPLSTNAPRTFTRQSARFELVDSASLVGMKPLDYLSKHVFITPGRKLIFARTFNKFYEDSIEDGRFLSPNDVFEALTEVMGKPLTNKQHNEFKKLIGEIKEPLNFRTWCGICAVCERLLSSLSPRAVDSPSWIEQADFGALKRRLKDIEVDEKLLYLLNEIHDR